MHDLFAALAKLNDASKAAVLLIACALGMPIIARLNVRITYAIAKRRSRHLRSSFDEAPLDLYTVAYMNGGPVHAGLSALFNVLSDGRDGSRPVEVTGELFARVVESGDAKDFIEREIRVQIEGCQGLSHALSDDEDEDFPDLPFSTWAFDVWPARVPISTWLETPSLRHWKRRLSSDRAEDIAIRAAILPMAAIDVFLGARGLVLPAWTADRLLRNMLTLRKLFVGQVIGLLGAVSLAISPSKPVFIAIFGACVALAFTLRSKLAWFCRLVVPWPPSERLLPAGVDYLRNHSQPRPVSDIEHLARGRHGKRSAPLRNAEWFDTFILRYHLLESAIRTLIQKIAK